MIYDRVESARISVRFARKAIELREQAGLTQEEVGIRAGLHRTEVSLLERRERVPRLETILRLAGGVDAAPWELLEGMAWNLHPNGSESVQRSGHATSPLGQEVVSGNVGDLSPAKRFGLLLTRERLHAGRTQAEVASLLSVHHVAISRYERGRQEPRLDSILKLAAAVESAPAELLTGMAWIPGSTVILGHYDQRPGEIAKGNVNALLS